MQSENETPNKKPPRYPSREAAVRAALELIVQWAREEVDGGSRLPESVGGGRGAEHD
jgi:hypothetical protein